jgi:ribosomal protein S18 acetylase RimI-like enzyme
VSSSTSGALTYRALAARDAPACDAVILSLPDFFGLQDGRDACAKAVRSEQGIVAVDDDDVVGFATWTKHRPHAAEITWAAVHHDRRGDGIGRQIVDAVEAAAIADGVTWMKVMTQSSNDPHAATYTPTRHFWSAVAGYTELCDLDVWGADLAVLMVKRVG